MVKELIKLIVVVLLFGTASVYASDKPNKVSIGENMSNKSNNIELEESLPDYVTADISDLKAASKTSIRTETAFVKFPLSKEDIKDIEILGKKFDNEKNCAGLAAPQIGISKRIIIFAAPDNPELKKGRPDLTQSMPRTLWINPSYKPIGTEMHEDYKDAFL